MVPRKGRAVGEFEAFSGRGLNGLDVGQGCHLSRDDLQACLRGHSLCLIPPSFCIGSLASLEEPDFEGHVKNVILASRLQRTTACMVRWGC